MRDSKINLRRNIYVQFTLSIIMFLVCNVLSPVDLLAAPTINFTDIESGPKTGNTDGAGGLTASQHGAIVTVWGNYSGSVVKAFYKDSTGASREAAHYYYEKKADGTLPGGPADLYGFHKMREIAFSIPAEVADGPGVLWLNVDGIDTINGSTGLAGGLPFAVRTGKIYFIKPTGNDTTGNGSWGSPWKTLHNVTAGNNNKIVPGDIVYIVGVNVTDSPILIGQYARLTGTAANPFSFIVYPNTRSTLKGGSGGGTGGNMLFYNYGAANSYWNYSKFNFETVERVLGLQKGMRVIGNNVTGPSLIGNTMTGWIGGNCTGAADPSWCGGAKIFGNEVHHYGQASSANNLMHLYYISNRSGSAVEGYEIAWNNHHDNIVYQGIHVYDQGPQCGGWSTPIKIHHNVVKNQSGSSINLNVGCPDINQFEVHDNLLILDPDFQNIIPTCGTACSNSCLSACALPGSAFRIQTPGVIKVYHNTVYGYRTPAVLTATTGTLDFSNNLIVDTQKVPYSAAYSPTVGKGNLCYTTSRSSLSLPAWATGEKLPSLFMRPGIDFRQGKNSPATNKSDYVVKDVAPTDFHGQPRFTYPVTIGAFGSTDETAPPWPPIIRR